ncbi:MAG: ACT domain-containing protein [Patescibacteria group bacterium]
MITISESIKAQLAKKPYIAELLSENLVNIMSLSRNLRPTIEEETMKDVTDEAIAMAIRRFVDDLPKDVKISSIFSETPDILVRSHLCEFTIKKEGSTGVIEKLIKTLSLSKENFFTITQGVFEDTIIASDVYESVIRKTLELQQIIAFFDKLSAITVRLPPENVDMPGVYYHLLKSLANNGINVMEVVSTYRECTIIVREKDVDEAFRSVKKIFG